MIQICKKTFKHKHSHKYDSFASFFSIFELNTSNYQLKMKTYIFNSTSQPPQIILSTQNEKTWKLVCPVYLLT